MSEARMRQSGQKETAPRETGPREIGPKARKSPSVSLYFGDEDAILQTKKEDKTTDATYAKSSTASGRIRKLINHTHITSPLGSRANQLQVPVFQRSWRKQSPLARHESLSQVLPESDTDTYDEPEDTQPASNQIREGDASHLVVVPHRDHQQEHAKGFLSKFRSSPQ
ncbi:hypothetical protein CYMTET_16296 [Cymbomonas tetramitiformis]|uniref:Uncharacterized protein n=1 Tax=Cymbomonas tetramitiformis TaxID=36881 RepID=A0AAE0L860_9CHLO|nr:hypothetical protein CYMTET_16296 [Cymbomonas tetramitiformis]